MKRMLVAIALLTCGNVVAAMDHLPADQIAFWTCNKKSNLAAVAAAAKYAKMPVEDVLKAVAEDGPAHHQKEMFAMVLRAYEMPIKPGISPEDHMNETKGDAIGRCMEKAGILDW